jgi:gluconolactonase
MRQIFIVLTISLFTIACQSGEGNEYPLSNIKDVAYKSVGTIERLDKALDKILAKDAKIEILAEGFEWAEGPLWISDKNYLLFTDIPPDRIFKWEEGKGVSLYLEPSGYTGAIARGGEPGANGLLLDNKGRLVMCQHGDRRMARMNAPLDDPKPLFITLADMWDGRRFNSPNDGVFKSNGDLYFTDPPYGLEKSMEDPLKEIGFQGVYRRRAGNGRVDLLTADLTRPNGIAFSPDESILYVSNSDPKNAVWMAYEINNKGLFEKSRVFYDVTSLVDKEKGLPDGLKVDKAGNLFATGPGGIWIFNSLGKVIGKIKTGEATANCAFDDTGKVLYITADMYLMRVVLK